MRCLASITLRWTLLICDNRAKSGWLQMSARPSAIAMLTWLWLFYHMIHIKRHQYVTTINQNNVNERSQHLGGAGVWILHHGRERPFYHTQSISWLLKRRQRISRHGFGLVFTEYSGPSTRSTLLWRHNDHDEISIHQPHGCLLNRLFRRRSKETLKLRVTGLNFPHKGSATRKMFPFDDVIMRKVDPVYTVASK